jgi:hypothetical protein
MLFISIINPITKIAPQTIHLKLFLPINISLLLIHNASSDIQYKNNISYINNLHHMSDNGFALTTPLNRTIVDLLSSGASLPVKGCGSAIARMLLALARRAAA